MADGSQYTFGFKALPTSRLQAGEIVVDLFAGGGGASEALEQALGRPVDIAINHDPWAIGMHAANHPYTQHHCEDVWHADPRAEVAGRLVGWLHASPDCTHFSQAKGGQPRDRATRSLSWVVLKWVGMLARAGRAPRILSLENVEQILRWGPLVAKRCKQTGRVMRLDGTIAAPGQRTPIAEQFLVPDPRHAGRTWRQFVAALRSYGYAVEWNRLVASDFGAGTSRKRLFLIARRDGQPIVWPEPTHGPRPHQQPVVPAAACIDWSIECPSIFGRRKQLAEATLRRIAKGVKRYVLDTAQPFIVGCGGRASQSAEKPVTAPLNTVTSKADSCIAVPVLAPVLTEHANASRQAVYPVDEPLRTQCAQVKGGHFAVMAPVLVQAAHGEGRPGAAQRWGAGAKDAAEPLGTVTASNGHALAAATLVQTGYGERAGQDARALDPAAPLGTVVAGGVKHAAVCAFLEQANTGMVGHDAREPMSTIVGRGTTQRVVSAHLMHASTSNTNGGRGRVDLPLRTVLAGGQHHAVVECTLSPEQEASALQVAAFLVKYYGTAAGVDLAEPLDTITTRDRLALVTVLVHGTPHVIVDIGLRMLKPRELYRAQGFRADYIIDRTADGRAINTTRSVRMVGNSVSPPPLCAVARANLDTATALYQAA